MKKKSLLIILLLSIVLLTACGKKDEVKEKTADEVKEIMEKEKEFTSGDNVHQEFLNVESFKEAGLNIVWEDKPKTINIRGNMIQGYEVNANVETYDGYDTYVFGVDGTLYRNHNGNYSIMKPDDKVLKIGTYYPNHGGSNMCSGYSEYVIETENGIQYFDTNEEGAVAIKKLDEEKYFVMPVCYGVADSKLMDNVVIYDDGRIEVNEVVIKDKATKEKINAKYVIYAEKEEKEKYYVITGEDKLYIIDGIAEYYEAIPKVSVNVKPSVEDEEDLDVDVEISAEGVTISMKYLANRS